MKKTKWTRLLAWIIILACLFPGASLQAQEQAFPQEEVEPAAGEGHASLLDFAFPPYQDNLTANKSHFSYFDETKALLVGEVSEGKLLFEKNSDQPLGIASMTKLMTYYIVKKDIQAGKIDPKQMVTVSTSAAEYNVKGSSNYGLMAGEQLSVERLLMGMMVVSGNDAAAQLGELVSGTEEAFTDRMNQEALALGMTKTHFVNASGFTVDGKYNTASARDMFKLCAHIVHAFPEIRDYIKITHVTEKERNYDHASTISLASVQIPGMLGLNTGVTEEAGYCFAGYFDVTSTIDKSDYEIITLVMGAPSDDARWRMSKELVDLTAGSFSKQTLVDAALPVARYEMPDAKEGSVVLYPAASFSNFTFASKQFAIKYDLYDQVKAPSQAEQKFGEITVYDGDKIVKVIDIISHAPTSQASLWERTKRGASDLVRILLSMVG